MKAWIPAVVLWLFCCSTSIAENWPRFRGPTGQGVSQETNLPVRWSEDHNVAWQVRIPGEGWSSPIVWQDLVIVTSAEDDGADCYLIAIDRRRGEIAWKTKVLRQVPERKEGKNSYATPTPVTDGERIYAVFADGSAVAVDFQGQLIWSNREIKHYSRHGLGASPLVHQDLLIMPYDGSNRVSQAGDWPNNSDEERLGWQIPWDQAKIVAFDTATGTRRWTAKRGMSRVAHASPNVLAESGQVQLISTAGDVIQGFDLRDGKRIWSAFSQGEGVVPSVVIGDGLLFTCSGYEATTIRTVRTGGEGDVTETHIAWENSAGTPTQPSMLYIKPFLYGISDKGVLHCYAAESGEVVWRKRIGGNHSASLVYADGKIYTLSEEGETAVVLIGNMPEILATNQLPGLCQASMAVSRGNLFIRTDQHLYCIGPPPQ